MSTCAAQRSGGTSHSKTNSSQLKSKASTSKSILSKPAQYQMKSSSIKFSAGANPGFESFGKFDQALFTLYAFALVTGFFCATVYGLSGAPSVDVANYVQV